MMFHCNHRHCSLLLAILLTLPGCQDQRRPDYASLGLVPVEGIVRMDGKPLAGVTVRFESENGTFSHGKTDAAGKYRLMYNSEQAGIPPGKKIVRITSHGIGERASSHATAAEDIPAEYNTQSRDVVEVSETSRTFDFELSRQSSKRSRQ